MGKVGVFDLLLGGHFIFHLLQTRKVTRGLIDEQLFEVVLELDEHIARPYTVSLLTVHLDDPTRHGRREVRLAARLHNASLHRRDGAFDRTTGHPDHGHLESFTARNDKERQCDRDDGLRHTIIMVSGSRFRTSKTLLPARSRTRSRELRRGNAATPRSIKALCGFSQGITRRLDSQERPRSPFGNVYGCRHRE